MQADGKDSSALSEARRALLQRYLRGDRAPAETKAATIPRRSDRDYAPLSYSQQQIWLHSQLAGEALIYNEPITIHRQGALNAGALEQAFTEIVRRHEAWRTTFQWEGDHGVQIVQPAPDRVRIPFVDLSASFGGTSLRSSTDVQKHVPPAEREREALRLATDDARQPFDLARGPMYRLKLVSLGDDKHRLYLTLHHIIFDGVSLYRVLLPELLASYEAFARSAAPELPALPIQYLDYAIWQRGSIREIAAEQLSYWQKICADVPVLDLPTDHPRPATQTYNGALEALEISPATTVALKALSQAQGATPFMTMIAAFVALLHGATGDEDIVVGGISSGRQHNETMGLLGCFLNTVPIRVRFSKDEPFTELLARVRQATLGALSHDEVPFELLVQKFGRQRDPSRAPLVQVLLVVEPPLEPLPIGWRFTHMDVDPGTAKFDLQLGLDDRPEGLTGRFIYNTDLFERATIQELRDGWVRLLDRIALTPGERVTNILSSIRAGRAEARPSGGTSFRRSERGRGKSTERPPASWNETRTDYPRDTPIHELFEEQARATPAAIALVFGEIRLSYEELNRRANQLARHLQKLGVARDLPVGVCLERSPEMIIALLAVLKAGGAYVPFDPAYPAERIRWMIADTGTRVILTQTRLRNSLGTGTQLVCLDEENFAGENAADLAHEVRAEDLAYIIYTSGSTGVPKGVAVPHRAVVRLVRQTNYASFAPDEVFLQLAPLSFDASTFEIWGPLLNGGRLVMMPPTPPTLADIGRAIREHGVTTLWLTSALFNAMVDECLADLRPLRQLLAGGDVLSTTHVAKALRELETTRLINGYGPTESTTFACCHLIKPGAASERAIPIGRPIANTTAHILDANLKPVSIGATGELHLGGDGLARGYWRREELTAEKFIADPFSDEPGARLYRTGDLARWRSDGVIEFLGRADGQIKLRGFRIEPGEIEAVLKEQTGVLDAAVIVREDSPNEKRLVAYIVETGPTDAATHPAALKRALPDYMVPSAIIPLAALPRTLNGKLDRSALPAPQIAQEFIPASTALEEKIAAVWANVLGLERIGATDNFFEVGGHSLLGLRLINQLREALGEPVSLAFVFEAPTPAKMAALFTKNYPAATARWTQGEAAATSTRSAFAPIVSVNRESRRARRP